MKCNVGGWISRRLSPVYIESTCIHHKQASMDSSVFVPVRAAVCGSAAGRQCGNEGQCGSVMVCGSAVVQHFAAVPQCRSAAVCGSAAVPQCVAVPLQTNSKYTLGVLKLYHGCIGGVNGVSLLQLEGVYKVYTDVLRVYCCADIFGCTEGVMGYRM